MVGYGYRIGGTYNGGQNKRLWDRTKGLFGGDKDR